VKTATILDSNATSVLYLVLPLVTYLDVTSRVVPILAFYGYWILCSAILGLLVGFQVSGITKNTFNSILALCCVVLSVSIITPLSVPFNIIDNAPSTPQTVHLAQVALSLGNLPTSNSLSYLNYPSAILTLSALLNISALSSPFLTKVLGILLALIPMLAFYSMINNKSIAISVATIAGSTPWVVGSAVHYFPAGVGAVLLSLNLAVLARSAFYGYDKRLLLMMVLASCALTVTDVMFSLVWIVFLVGFVTLSAIMNLRNGSKGQSFYPILLISATTWLGWYVLPSIPNGVIATFENLASDVFGSSGVATSYLQPSGARPVFFVGVEYAAFLSIAILSMVAFFHYRHWKPIFSATIGGACVAAIAIAFPYLAVFGVGTDLFSRSAMVFQLGVAPAIGSLLFIRAGRHKQSMVPITLVIVTLIALNGLLYGVSPPTRYDATAPRSVNDTLFNLESWYYLSVALCQHVESGQTYVWGVRTGLSFVFCMRYYQLVPTVPADALLNLRATLGPNQLVILRESIGQIPEWVQKLPASPSSIIARYDVVFTSGDPVLIYT
jgi:hypothetical protein